jgi:dGTPase
VRLVDRVAYINHDIDDAVRAGVLEPAELPADGDRAARPDRPARIDTLVHDLVETSERAGDIRQSDESARRCSRSARSCSSASTWRAAQPNQKRAHEIIRRIFDHLVDEGRRAGRDRLTSPA